jgi:hypothetical protein
MQPGTKRIAFGGVALALLAWFAIGAWLPDEPAPSPATRNADGLTPIPEIAPRASRPKPTDAATGAIAPGDAIAAVLVGCFRGTTTTGTTVVERYRRATDGEIEGELAETAADGTPIFDERMRIAPDEGVWRYHPAPGGVPAAVSFALVQHAADALRFEELAHDYPQVIVYERHDAELTTRIEGVEGGATKREVYTTRAEACP